MDIYYCLPEFKKFFRNFRFESEHNIWIMDFYFQKNFFWQKRIVNRMNILCYTLDKVFKKDGENYKITIYKFYT